MITVEYLRERLDFDPLTGVFTWKLRAGGCREVRRWNSRYAGKVAGTATKGYLQVLILKRPYKAHRLAWLYVHGRWPKECIDHIDGDGSNNRLSNLREATRAENNQNRRDQFDCASWHAVTGKWQARININGRQTHLGVFADRAEAVAVYRAAKARFHQFQPIPREAAQ